MRAALALEDAGRGEMTEQAIAAFCEKVKDTRARRAIALIFGDVFKESVGREIGAGSLTAFAEAWVKQLESTIAPQSFLKYRHAISNFISFLGPKAGRDLTTFGARDDVLVIQFRDEMAARLSAASVNTTLKIVRQMFKTAEQRFRIENPARLVGGVKPRDHEAEQRRAFTLPEIGRILREVHGSEWEGIILAGIYTGQRLSDIVRLRWENVDLVRQELALTTRKTHRRILIPLTAALADYLTELPTGDDPKAFVFPAASSRMDKTAANQSGTLSNQFYEILVRAGLVTRRPHTKADHGKGRGGRRGPSTISFHSFRHTTTSLLKNAGVPQSVVMDIIGHESKAVSQVYTHVGDTEKRLAVEALPSLQNLIQASGGPSTSRILKRKAPKK